MRNQSHAKNMDILSLWQAHWQDLALRCERDCRPYFTDFLPEEDLILAQRIARQMDVQCIPWGGTEHTTRVMLCFCPKEFPLEYDQFPIQCLTMTYRASKTLSHRDFLGALLSCGIERDTVGDILIGENMAQVFVCRRIADMIQQELWKVAQTDVHVDSQASVCLSAEVSMLPIVGTVASLRADVITAFVTRLSREKALQLIRQGRLVCRHKTIDSPSVQMQIGDVIAVRGYGKFRIDGTDGITRKGRYHITIQKYQ